MREGDFALQASGTLESPVTTLAPSPAIEVPIHPVGSFKLPIQPSARQTATAQRWRPCVAPRVSIKIEDE